MLVWIYHPEERPSNNLESVIFQKTCEIGGQIEGRDGVSVPTEGQVHLWVDLRENPPRENVSLVSLFSNYTFISPQKKDMWSFSSLLARVLLTQKVTSAEKFEVWAFIHMVSHHLKTNLRLKLLRRVILSHCKQFTTI